MSGLDTPERGFQISRRQALAALGLVGVAGADAVTRTPSAYAADRGGVPTISGRVVAVGIPGASAIAPVGTFLPGSPIHSNPVLAAFTQPGRVCDPTRIVVGSRSNFGAPKANPDQAAGSFLSIDPGGADLAVPDRFAASGGQASALGGAVQMYSAQSPNWRNGFYTPGAVTADQTAVANPLGMSINNAFGRFWPANAPYGLNGPGSSSIADPDGRPLAGAPNPTTGGVYFGDITGRTPTQVIPGAISKAAVGTALIGRSPDGSGRAVFAVVVADGSVVQEHTVKALDGIAPPRTVQPLVHRSWGHDSGHRGRVPLPRLGVLISYAPELILYVSQPFDDSIKVIELTIGGPQGNEVFVPSGLRTIRSSALDQPLDLAPVRIDTTHPDHASNTTLQPGSDIYICNRGNDTIVRMRQDGTTVGVRRVRLGRHSLGGARLNGIATSTDGSRIWVTYVGALPGGDDAEGGVLELPAF
ncbi:hypothetical protein EV643_11079 [Kribbella sp. VKM Ac-2527]|uniref:Uncharacterized protein n=1 Tax=Kribbella caucasensis TaxID=2512215 RepID=A0A4R6KF29_9ACTN|nr:hypothetical protein [Kribbella sp. VKM Ac-2527]TDO46696.1 hypothetical protein EV643_11079 [Kribbella sp. VKM Ac-2527]